MKKNFFSAGTIAIIFLTLAAFAFPAAGTEGLYRWVDKDGQVTYSDSPPPKDAIDAQKKTLGDNVTGGGEDAIPFVLKSAMQRNPVILYVNNCGEICDQARALLSKRGIPFTGRNPETDPGAAEALKDLIGALNVPTLAIGNSPQSGFDASAWNTALDSAGYPRFNVLSPNLKSPLVPTPAAETPKAPAAPTPTPTPTPP